MSLSIHCAGMGQVFIFVHARWGTVVQMRITLSLETAFHECNSNADDLEIRQIFRQLSFFSFSFVFPISIQ